MASSSRSSHRESKRWEMVKPGVILGLKALEKGLDGLPVPGAKGCVTLIIQAIEKAEVASENAEALESVQRRLESLHEMLSPIYAKKSVNVPGDVQKDVRNLAMKLEKLASQWGPKLERKNRKRDYVLRLVSAEDDRVSLTRFASAVEQTIQDFLVITTTNGRIAAFKEEVRNREARALGQLPRAHAASYNSVRTAGANTCLEGTRVSILQTIRKWAMNTDYHQPPMFWLNGLAGIGKTTIAHTIASELDAKGLLGGSFVFLRAVDELRDARLVFPTLAFQLAQFNSDYRAALVEALEADPDCGSQVLDLQFQKLILQPLSTVSFSAPVILILDALDECGPEKLTGQLLRLLHKQIKSVPFLRIFITSRPEGYIREALDLVDATSPHRKLVLHEDVYSEEVENDIRLFLKTRLQELWDERTKQSSVQWPSDHDLDTLVRQSGKLFVYAATAVRFIGGNRILNLNRQLNTLLNVKIGHVPDGEPYRQLDGLYLQILDGIFVNGGDEYYVQRFRNVVGTIVLLERPLPLQSLAAFLGDHSVDEITETLYHLHSIIVVPVESSDAPRTYHLSFPNFITSSERCSNPKPYIDPIRQSKYLFLRCLAVMASDFKLRYPKRDDRLQITSEEIPDLLFTSSDDELESFERRSVRSHDSLEPDYEDLALPLEVRYSNNHWCHHLLQTPPADREAASALENFIHLDLHFWTWRRKDMIHRDLEASNTRLVIETFDMFHNAHRWAVRAHCGSNVQEIIKFLASTAFRQIFNAPNMYEFGTRLSDMENLMLVFRQNSHSAARMSDANQQALNRDARGKERREQRLREKRERDAESNRRRERGRRERTEIKGKSASTSFPF